MFVPMKSVLLWLSFLLFFGCSPKTKEKLVFPANTWETTPPATFKINQEKLNEALAYLKEKSFQDGIEEVLIIKNGRIIYEGDSTHLAHNIYSCSKGFTSTVLGLMIDQGKVKLDDYVAKYDTDLKALYPKVTFRHFATMTSGYSAEGRSRWNDENADWSWTPYQPEKPHLLLAPIMNIGMRRK